MARKIILKSNGLDSEGIVPNGYKYVGDISGDISEKIGATISGINSSPIAYELSVINQSISFSEHLGSGITIAPKNPVLPDVDLSKGNYNSINIYSQTRSVKLPIGYGDNLVYLSLATTVNNDDPCVINLSNYPNLGVAFINPGLTWRSKKFSFEIGDDIIDLPRCGGLHLGGSNRVLCCKVNPNLTIKAYRDMTVSIVSNYLENLTLDYINFQDSGYLSVGPGTDGTVVYKSSWKVENCPNLTGLSFSNMGVYTNSSSVNSALNFLFKNNGLSQLSIDNFLIDVANSFDTSNVPGVIDLSSDLSSYAIASGTLIIGNSYVISSATFIPGDDFDNVGFVSLDVPFVAVADTPTSWANGSPVIPINQGGITTYEVVGYGANIPMDGTYYTSNFHFTWTGGTISSIDIIGAQYSSTEVGRVIEFTGWVLYDTEDPNRIIWAQDVNLDYTVYILVTGVGRNGVPTDGSSNGAKLYLEGLGWTVYVNDY